MHLALLFSWVIMSGCLKVLFCPVFVLLAAWIRFAKAPLARWFLHETSLRRDGDGGLARLAFKERRETLVVHFSAQQTEGSFFSSGAEKRKTALVDRFWGWQQEAGLFWGWQGPGGGAEMSKEKNTACGISEGQCRWLQMFLPLWWKISCQAL